MNLKKQLRHHLDNTGITASELSRRSGVPKQTISDWLAGVPPRSIPYVKQIADAFETTIDNLLFGDAPDAVPLSSLHKGAPGEQRHFAHEKLLNGIPDMIGYWDSDMKNVYANPAYAHYLGKPPEQIRGRSLGEVLSNELYQKNLPHVLAALAGEQQIFERTIAAADGKVKHTIAKYLPDIVDGRVCGFCVVKTDISPIKTNN